MSIDGIDEAVPFALPLTRRFRGTELREGMLLRIGSTWGEWAPFPEYDDATAARWLAGALEAARGEWPAARRTRVEVNAIVPALTDLADVTARVLDAVATDGCTVVKVKVAEPGQSFADDVARVAAVRAALDDAGAESGRIRVDVNARLERRGGGASACPCSTTSPAASSTPSSRAPRSPTSPRCAGTAPACASRSTRACGSPATSTTPPSSRIREAADVLVLKAIPLGGVRRSLDLARRVGLPVTVSGALDSTVGLSAGLALAGALEETPYACGFGTGRLLAADLTAETALPVDGRLSVVRHAAPTASPPPRARARRARRRRSQRCPLDRGAARHGCQTSPTRRRP